MNDERSLLSSMVDLRKGVSQTSVFLASWIFMSVIPLVIRGEREDGFFSGEKIPCSFESQCQYAIIRMLAEVYGILEAVTSTYIHVHRHLMKKKAPNEQTT